MGEITQPLTSDQLAHQLASGRTRPVTPQEISRDEIYHLVHSLASSFSQGGLNLREVRNFIEPALEYYISEDLRSTHKRDGIARAIGALEVLQYTGCFTPSLLGSVAATASWSRDSGDAALHTDVLRSASVETLLCHPRKASPCEGLKIDAFAKVLSFFDPKLAPETFQEICEQLLSYTKVDLLMSPTVWGIFGLNPNLLSATWMGKESAVLLSQHLTPAGAPHETLTVLRELQSKPWSHVVDDLCDVLDSMGYREFAIRARCIRLVEEMRSLPPTNELRITKEIALANLFHENGSLLISQLMSDGVFGRFHTSSNDGAYRLSGRVGALSAEQIHRICSQPFPVREIHIHGHHDGGYFGIPLSTKHRKDDIQSAHFRLGVIDAFLDDQEGVNFEQRESDYSTISEANAREREFVAFPLLESTTTEFAGYLRSPIFRNTESLNIPLSIIALVKSSLFPHLKELELWGSAKDFNAQSAKNLPRTLTSLICDDGTFLSKLSDSPGFLELGKVKVSELTIKVVPESTNLQSLMQSIDRYALSKLTFGGIINHPFLEELVSYPQLLSLDCHWPTDRNTETYPNLSQLKEVVIRNCTPDVARQLKGSRLSGLRSLTLLQTSASLSEVTNILDTLTEPGLIEFSLCGPVSWHESELVSLLKHPRLENLKMLRLGLSPFVSVVENLVKAGRYPELHTLDLTNPHAKMMDSPLPKELEQELLLRTLTGSFSKLTLSFNPAQYSLCREVSQQGFGELQVKGQHFEVYTTRELGYRGNESTFLIQRKR